MVKHKKLMKLDERKKQNENENSTRIKTKEENTKKKVNKNIIM